MNYGTTVDLTKIQLDNRKLYPYQEAATENLNEYFDLENPTSPQNGLLVMPTGSGKTFTAVNWLLQSAVSRGYKVIWFAHRKDLIEQATYSFIHRAPILLNYGIKKFSIMPISGEHYSMSQASKSDVYVCSIQSAASKNGLRFIKNMLGTKGKEKVVVVIDEAHHAVMPSFRKILDKITKLNKNRVFLGLTATPTRMQESEQMRLYKMFDCFKDVEKAKINKDTPKFIYEVKLKDLITNGTLASPKYQRIETNLIGNVEFDIDKKDEEYYEKYGELSEKIKDQLANSAYRNKIIVDEYIKNRDKYGKTLVFAVNKNHAYTLDQEFKKAFKEKNLDITSEYCISGDNNNQEKINEFKRKKDGVFINVQILTEGSDVPDIQTVFLTRQTNSESLLMQMIGRGLRGKVAGGTETLNVVDFHDTWEKFKFWLDPKFIIDGLTGDSDPGSKPGKMVSIPWDVTMDIYSRMVANVTSKSNSPIVPDGWYSVVNDDGEDDRIIVFDNQLESYKSIEDNIDKIDGNTNAMDLIKRYFILEESIPNEHNIEQLIRYIDENKKMPEYFEFEGLKIANSVNIAEYLAHSDLNFKEIRAYIKDTFNSDPIFKEIYGEFKNFEDIVLDQMALVDEPQNLMKIEYLDEREDYNIEENYFDLENLLKEVIEKVEDENWFEPNKDVKIMYSDRPVKNWFGLCTRYPDGKYIIRVNKLLSSPNVNENVIKYLIYHELLHASGYWPHDKQFRNKEWLYEDSEVYDNFLDRLMIDYNVENALKELGEKTKAICGADESKREISKGHKQKKNSNLSKSKKTSKPNIKKYGYDDITVENAYKIKNIMEKAQIEKNIDLKFDVIKASIHIENLSENVYFNETNYETYLLGENNNEGSLDIKNRKYNLKLGVSDWISNARIKGVHFCLGSGAFGDYFAQIELSQAIEDEKYIYIVKNISKLGGEGAISRLNKNAEDKDEKHLRRMILVEKLESKIISYNNSQWIVVDRILKSDLDDESKYPNIAYDFILNFLKYAFCIEEIIEKH